MSDEMYPQLFEYIDPKDQRPHWQKTEIGLKGRYDLYDGTPPHEAPETSHAAAVSMAPHVNKMQNIVLQAIGKRGRWGATDDELEEVLQMKHQTVSARRRELVLLGKIESVGKRKTRSGRQANVWVRKAN